jgi:dTDP-glucose 4,6-dehydratase
MRVLVTGCAGFIGSNFVRILLERETSAEVFGLDALTYAGHRSTMKDFARDSRFKFFEGNIQNSRDARHILRRYDITHVVNFAAESHNDRSLTRAGTFVKTNTYGVYALLEASKGAELERFLHVSTDEVYGSTSSGRFNESSPLEPNTPYSAAKAGGELMARAYLKSFGIPVIVTRGGNTYGPYHYPEKLIPFFTTRLIRGKKVPLYGEGCQIREWIHVKDHASGILTALLKGDPGEIYNVGDNNEQRNIDVTHLLLKELQLSDNLVKFIPDPRKGAHDLRYSMSCDKLRELGWKPSVPFQWGIRETVAWYVKNQSWWKPILGAPEYKEYIRRFYGPSLGDDL